MEGPVARRCLFAPRCPVRAARGNPSVCTDPGTAPEPAEGPATLREEVAKVERRLISQALERHNWNKVQAARELDLSYPTLLQKIKLFHLDRRQAVRQRF